MADGELIVGTLIPETVKGAELPDDMCHVIGFGHHDRDGIDLGFEHVRIRRGSTDMAWCGTVD